MTKLTIALLTLFAIGVAGCLDVQRTGSVSPLHEDGLYINTGDAEDADAGDSTDGSTDSEDVWETKDSEGDVEDVLDASEPNLDVGEDADAPESDDGQEDTAPDGEGDSADGGNDGSNESGCLKNEDCDDGNACTTDLCNPGFGCTNNLLAAGTICNDDNPCTVNDTCDGNGTCGGDKNPCDDGNPCTDDSCDSKDGCVYTANTMACDDSSACTTGDICSEGVCAGVAVDCSSLDTPCTEGVCNANTGACEQQATNEGSGCNDDNPCTVNDACSDGECTGAAKGCDDGNPCTDDSCDPVIGCVHEANSAPCDDGDPCTVNDVCAAGLCGGTPKSCDDGEPCTKDICNEGECFYAAVADDSPCEDDDPCTLNETCHKGECGSDFDDCDDGDPCTVDTCDEDGAGCSYADAECDDGIACTIDSCLPGEGCVHDDSNCHPCNEDLDCHDSDPSTYNKCVQGYCEYPTKCSEGYLWYTATSCGSAPWQNIVCYPIEDGTCHLTLAPDDPAFPDFLVGAPNADCHEHINNGMGCNPLNDPSKYTVCTWQWVSSGEWSPTCKGSGISTCEEGYVWSEKGFGLQEAQCLRACESTEDCPESETCVQRWQNFVCFP